LYRVSKIELIEFCVAFVVPLIIGLEIGIFASIATSIIVNLLRHSFTSIIYLGRLQSKLSADSEYVDKGRFKSAKAIVHISIIEMKAELSFSNNNRLCDTLRDLLDDKQKFIVVSLSLTEFIDTTVIRQIVTIFEDAKGAFICLSQCRPNVIKLIRRYERENSSFPANVKTFVSTHSAVRYLQCKIREQMIEANDGALVQCLDKEKEPSLIVSLSHPRLHGDVTPIIKGKDNAEMSMLEPLDEVSIDLGGQIEEIIPDDVKQ